MLQEEARKKAIEIVDEESKKMNEFESISVEWIAGNSFQINHTYPFSTNGNRVVCQFVAFETPPPIPPDMTPVWVKDGDAYEWRGPYVSNGKIDCLGRLETYNLVNSTVSWKYWTTEDPRKEKP